MRKAILGILFLILYSGVSAASYFASAGRTDLPLAWAYFLINVGTECQNLIERWPGEWRSQRFLGNLLTEGEVIGVEEAMKLLAKGSVVDQIRPQHEGLEEAGGMSLVPLGRTGLRT